MIDCARRGLEALRSNRDAEEASVDLVDELANALYGLLLACSQRDAAIADMVYDYLHEEEA